MPVPGGPGRSTTRPPRAPSRSTHHRNAPVCSECHPRVLGGVPPRSRGSAPPAHRLPSSTKEIKPKKKREYFCLLLCCPSWGNCLPNTTLCSLIIKPLQVTSSIAHLPPGPKIIIIIKILARKLFDEFGVCLWDQLLLGEPRLPKFGTPAQPGQVTSKPGSQGVAQRDEGPGGGLGAELASPPPSAGTGASVCHVAAAGLGCAIQRGLFGLGSNSPIAQAAPSWGGGGLCKYKMNYSCYFLAEPQQGRGPRGRGCSGVLRASNNKGPRRWR